MNLRVPSPADVAELLGMLLGRDVQTSAATDPASTALLGWYEFDDGRPAAIIVGDLPVAVATGAALSMLPPGVAQEAVAAGTLDATVRANFAEILNIGANLFMDEGAAHLRLVSTHDAASAPPTVAAFADAASRRADVAVTVAGYGSGTLSFRAA